MIHTSIRLYANGDITINGVESEDLASHICYNRTARWGTSLIVDGYAVVVSSIYKDAESKVEAFIKSDRFKNIKPMTQSTVPYK